MKVVYVTGNPGKAEYFSKVIGLDIEHHDADVDEIQSMNPEEIAVHKAKQAYAQIKWPVIVEDTCLSLDVLNGLPGPFIKWFETTLGLEGICRLADADSKRGAVASNIHVYYDGQNATLFSGSLKGSVPDHPRGDGGFGFNPIFIPVGESNTMAEMTDEEFIRQYIKIKPIMQLKKFLLDIDK